jgi:hypothetical protein
MKSKKRPKGMSARAVHKAPLSFGSKQYRIEEKIDITMRSLVPPVAGQVT